MRSKDFGLLLQFCETEPSTTGRLALSVPFVKSGYLYATDGRIAARVRTDAKDTEIPGLTFPDVNLPFDSVERCDPAPMPLPTFDGRSGGVCLSGISEISVRYWNAIAKLPGVRLVSEINPNKLIAYAFDFEGTGDGELVVMPFMADDGDGDDE